MIDDLEEFLRRAAEQRAQQQNPQVGPPQPPPPAEPLPTFPQSMPTLQPVEQPLEAEIVYAEPVSGVGQHVESHHFGESIAEHASHLAEGIELADERMESHLHEAFDHRIGSFDDSEGFAGDKVEIIEPPTPGSAAAEIAELFKSSRNIRNAFILKTILDRPEL